MTGKNKPLRSVDENKVLGRFWFESYKVREAVRLLKEKIKNLEELEGCEHESGEYTCGYGISRDKVLCP
jgi:hypothetical protein